ncbi:hypothetical protein Y1Q_0009158 [Alligator mississippiensis]|uniref:Uncharacterized protein n=1 Tax=Alligator mississippiensis TaxID=8496 RepID=A0A151M2G3_ALLMI|nr:hypothetical protein Y1Q_0009158 [Alligator mississippiensis]
MATTYTPDLKGRLTHLLCVSSEAPKNTIMELHDFLSGDHINKMNDAEMNSTDYPYTIDYEGLIEPCNKQEVRNFTKVFFPITYSLICVVGFIGLKDL